MRRGDAKPRRAARRPTTVHQAKGACGLRPQAFRREAASLPKKKRSFYFGYLYFNLPSETSSRAIVK